VDTQPAAGLGRPKLKRSLGLWMATALVIGNMVGSGVFGLPSSLASTGPISLVAWVITGAGAILLALVFANLGRAYPQTGGPYAFARRAFGDFAGFWTAWGYWIAAWAGTPPSRRSSSATPASSGRASAPTTRSRSRSGCPSSGC
jgi:amino acid transporter